MMPQLLRGCCRSTVLLILLLPVGCNPEAKKEDPSPSTGKIEYDRNLPKPDVVQIGTQQAPGLKRSGRVIENSAWADWAGFKVGSWVETENTDNLGNMMTTRRIRTTLLSRDADQMVLQSVVRDKEGQLLEHVHYVHPRELEEYVPIDRPVATRTPPMTQQGFESLNVAGKQLRCSVLRVHDVRSGAVTVTWRSDEVPGRTVRNEAQNRMKNFTLMLTMTVTAYESAR